MTKFPVCGSTRYHFNLDDNMHCKRCGYTNSKEKDVEIWRFRGDEGIEKTRCT